MAAWWYRYRSVARRAVRAARMELGRLLPGPMEADRVGPSVQASCADDPRFDVGSPIDLLLYYADEPENLYQARQWLTVLEQLAGDMRVAVLCRHPRAYLQLAEETHLPLLLVRYLRDLDALYAASDVKVCLYVNNHHLNFQSLTFADQLHVHVNHGESDKISMASNQAKAYDYVVVAGDAAVDRYRANLLDPSRLRCLKLGRPQLDLAAPHRPRADGRTCVVYAPTWEGGRGLMDYTSVAEMGEAIVERLLHAGMSVVYRPHPKTGSRRADVRQAHRRIIARLEAAQKRDGPGVHRVSADEPMSAAIAEGDVLIADVSSVTLDFLPTGRPIVVTRPRTAEGARIVASPVDEVSYRLESDSVHTLPDLLRDIAAEDRRQPERLALVERYFGDTTPGASMARFRDAMTELVAERQQLLAERRTRRGGQDGSAAPS